MRVEDMIIVSTDDHIVEPPHTFTAHVPAKYRDCAPHTITLPDGQERWKFVDRLVATPGGAAVVGRAPEELGSEPTKFEHMRKGCYDVHARIGDMNVNGTLAQMNFPTMPGLGGELFLAHPDKQVMEILVKAYNDFHIDEWCGAYPGRFIPLSVIPLWDPLLAVEEIKRVAGKGARAITFPENSTMFGLPSIHQDTWNPVWKALIDHDMTMAVHIGSGGGFRFPSLDSPADVGMVTMNMAMGEFVADLTFSPVLRAFPRLKVAVSEGYVGWLPFLMERSDYIYEMHKSWCFQDFGDKVPSDYMRSNFLFCFTEDPVGVKKLRGEIGIDRITFESDYPHADSTWPRSPERLWDKHDFASLTAEEIDKITHLNALNWFNWDPFTHIRREEATVGALREHGKDVDMTLLRGGSSLGKVDRGRVLTARDLVRLAEECDLAPTRKTVAAIKETADTPA